MFWDRGSGIGVGRLRTPNGRGGCAEDSKPSCRSQLMRRSGALCVTGRGWGGSGHRQLVPGVLLDPGEELGAAAEPAAEVLVPDPCTPPAEQPAFEGPQPVGGLVRRVRSVRCVGFVGWRRAVEVG